MSLVEIMDESELNSVRELFRDFIDNKNYLGALRYYFSLESKGQSLVKTDRELREMFDLAIEEAPYQKI